jgi:predicted metal-dependent peptidase
MAKTKQKKMENPEWAEAARLITTDRLFGKIGPLRFVDSPDDTRITKDQWAIIDRQGFIYCNTRKKGSAKEWAYVLAHTILHLCFSHFEKVPEDTRTWNYACDSVITRFLEGIRFGSAPLDYRVDFPQIGGDEASIYRELKLRGGAPEDYSGDMVIEKQAHYYRPTDYGSVFARALRRAVTESVRIASGVDPKKAWAEAGAGSLAQQARGWFMTNYPLIGAVAASFKIIEDLDACRALDIQVAAVCAAEQEIYINPLATLSLSEMKFVMAHEILHAALRHDQRVETRDHYLWNVSCDYAVNQWLVDMKLGSMPTGLLLDPELKGLSSEEIYDRITRDIRLQRKMRKARSFAGVGKPDMIGPKPPSWWERGAGVTLDEFYRSALSQGLEIQLSEKGRGYLPAGLIDEIRSQAMPPIPWDVKLADWLDQFFPIPEYRRSYARPSRRQAATPNIPRPNVIPVEGWDEGRTFGVVIDTSGSMSPRTLARGLGAISSYCSAREIPAVRIIFCDAEAYDVGYMTPEELAGRVRVQGRGGTVIQPGIDMLQRAEDFPKDGPILIITDTWIESNLSINREHAYLVPYGERLPFPAQGPVFTMPPDKGEW